MADYKPTPKVAAAGATGALAILIVYVAALFGLDVPEYVATAVGVLVAVAAGYFKSDNKRPKHRGKHEAAADV